MNTYTIRLTIGHDVKGVRTFKTRDVCEYVRAYLHVNAFTAFDCLGMWEGQSESSTRVELCGLTKAEADAIRENVPVLAMALAQDSIMCERRPDGVEFIGSETIAAAI